MCFDGFGHLDLRQEQMEKKSLNNIEINPSDKYEDDGLLITYSSLLIIKTCINLWQGKLVYIITYVRYHKNATLSDMKMDGVYTWVPAIARVYKFKTACH